jgi:hypothetical protein
MQGLPKGKTDTTLVTAKDHEAISCGYMNDDKLEKTAVNEDIPLAQPEDPQDDYSYYYYAGFYLGGMISALFLYLSCCTFVKFYTKSESE